MIEKKKVPISIYIIILIVLLVLFYFLSGLFKLEGGLEKLSENLEYIFTHFWYNWWNEKTPVMLGVGVLVFVFITDYISYHYRNFHSGVEKGSADWADIDEINKRHAPEKIEIEADEPSPIINLTEDNNV